MDNRKIFIIVILLLIIVGIIVIILTSSVNYERINITPNGTSMDVPADVTRYRGEFEGVKIWTWDKGALVTYNSHQEGINLNGISFNLIKEVIKSGEIEKIDNFTCYVINADELLEIHVFDIIKVNYNGKFYCIPLENGTSHDNIIICSKDKDVALHMAQSVEYKNVYPNSTNLDDAVSTVENITNTLESKANDYINDTNWSDIESTIGDKAGDLKSNIPYLNSWTKLEA